MSAPRPPLSGSLRALGASVIGILRTRLELLAIEVAEEKNRLLATAVWAVGGLLALFMGVLMATLLIVAAYWDTDHRFTAIALVAAAYLVVGIVALLVARGKLASAPLMFDETLAELERDRQVLSTVADSSAAERRERR